MPFPCVAISWTDKTPAVSKGVPSDNAAPMIIQDLRCSLTLALTYSFNVGPWRSNSGMISHWCFCIYMYMFSNKTVFC